MLFSGGSGWIRTTEVEDNRFTVCPLWPLGNTPKSNASYYNIHFRFVKGKNTKIARFLTDSCGKDRKIAKFLLTARGKLGILGLFQGTCYCGSAGRAAHS